MDHVRSKVRSSLKKKHWREKKKVTGQKIVQNTGERVWIGAQATKRVWIGALATKIGLK